MFQWARALIPDTSIPVDIYELGDAFPQCELFRAGVGTARAPRSRSSSAIWEHYRTSDVTLLTEPVLSFVLKTILWPERLNRAMLSSS
jgi:hypothetical protein